MRCRCAQRQYRHPWSLPRPRTRSPQPALTCAVAFQRRACYTIRTPALACTTTIITFPCLFAGAVSWRQARSDSTAHAGSAVSDAQPRSSPACRRRLGPRWACFVWRPCWCAAAAGGLFARSQIRRCWRRAGGLGRAGDGGAARRRGLLGAPHGGGRCHPRGRRPEGQGREGHDGVRGSGLLQCTPCPAGCAKWVVLFFALGPEQHWSEFIVGQIWVCKTLQGALQPGCVSYAHAAGHEAHINVQLPEPHPDGSVMSSHALTSALTQTPALAMGGVHAKPMSAMAVAAAAASSAQQRQPVQRTATPARNAFEPAGHSQVCMLAFCLMPDAIITLHVVHMQTLPASSAYNCYTHRVTLLLMQVAVQQPARPAQQQPQGDADWVPPSGTHIYNAAAARCYATCAAGVLQHRCRHCRCATSCLLVSMLLTMAPC